MFNQLAEFYKAYSDWIDAGAPDWTIHTNKNRIAWVKKEWQHYV